MPNTRDIRRRIKSVKNTAQITKAMQMVAASKMRKAQQLALSGRPYAQLMNRVLGSCKMGVDEAIHPLLQIRPVKKIGILLISTDKGLCGGLNANLFRETSHADPSKSVFVSVGRKGTQFLSRMKWNLIADFEMKETPTLAYTRKISGFLIDSYLKGEIDQIDVIFTDFISTINQKPIRKQLVPIVEMKDLQAGVHGAHDAASEWTGSDPLIRLEALFEPTAQDVLGALLPHYIHFQVYQHYLESKASEHSARMVAMKNATDNAKELIKDLSLEYNKVRQAAITREILEITTAQMAMS